MTSNPYRAPSSRVADVVSYVVPLSSAPLRVKAAIILSWLVLAVDTVNAFWQIQADAEAGGDLQLKSIWIAVALSSAAITAFLIVQTSQGRNWGRIGLLAWTIGSWGLWILYPQELTDVTSWKWSAAVALIVMELVALVLLFGGASAQWYASAKRGRERAL